MKAKLDMLVAVTETTGIDPVGNEERTTFPAWKSRDGRITKLVALETGHLRNILRMLFRIAFARELAYVETLPNDVESDIAERTPSESIAFEIEDAQPVVDEWARRGLVEAGWSEGALS